MEYRNLYDGHMLNAWTTEVGEGRWTWAFTIDDEAQVMHRGPPRTPEASVLEEAIAEARRTIDAYPKG